MNNCGNCKHYDEEVNICRRYPPDARRGFPEVTALDYCGEYAAKPAAAKK